MFSIIDMATHVDKERWRSTYDQVSSHLVSYRDFHSTRLV